MAFVIDSCKAVIANKDRLKRLKELIMSNIDKSHKAYVADVKFIPGSVKVDRKNPNEGKSYHFVSIAEDGIVNIWDTRNIEISELKKQRGKSRIWREN